MAAWLSGLGDSPLGNAALALRLLVAGADAGGLVAALNAGVGSKKVTTHHFGKAVHLLAVE